MRTQREYLTPGEAARALHVSPKTVIRWANAGMIPFMLTLGGHRRFLRTDIDAVVARLAVGAQNSPGD